MSKKQQDDKIYFCHEFETALGNPLQLKCSYCMTR